MNSVIHRSVSTCGPEVSIIITDASNNKMRQVIIEYDPEKPDSIRVNNRRIIIGG